MSDIGTAAMTVFGGVKDVAVDVMSGVVDVGTGLLTSGLATGSFGMNQNVSGTTALFGLVGNILGAGGSSVTGALGMGGSGPDSNFISNMMKTMEGAASARQHERMKDLQMQSLVAQGIMGGISSYMQGRKERKERERYDSSYIWGAQRRGGSGESVLQNSMQFSQGQGANFGMPQTVQPQQANVPVNEMQGPLLPQNQNQQTQQQPQRQTYYPTMQGVQQAGYGNYGPLLS